VYKLCDTLKPIPNCVDQLDTVIVTPITPDTVTITSACPTCPVSACTTGNDIDTTGGATYTSCGAPSGYSISGPNASGCFTYTPNGTVTSDDTTCQIVCKAGVCDTTYIIIKKPITPDTITVTPACPTCPVTVCTTGNDVNTTGGGCYI
jgi:hypothetical protein